MILIDFYVSWSKVKVIVAFNNVAVAGGIVAFLFNSLPHSLNF